MANPIEKFRLGTLPNIVEVEVPTPVHISIPFIPLEFKIVLFALIGAAIGLGYFFFVRGKKIKEATKQIEFLQKENEQNKKELSEVNENLSAFQKRYNTEKA